MVSTPNGRIWPPSSRPASRPTLLDRSGPRCPDSPVRTAIKILTIVGDGSAFPTAGHLAAYPGLAPVTRRSGTSIKGETRSQRGNHALKSALFLSAFASLADPASRAYYDRKRAQGKRHNATLICLAPPRTDVLFAMLRDRKPYTPRPPRASPIPRSLRLDNTIETPPGTRGPPARPTRATTPDRCAPPVAVLSRIRVAAIVTRVVAARADMVNRLAGCRRIGVDEISYARNLIT